MFDKIEKMLDEREHKKNEKYYEELCRAYTMNLKEAAALKNKWLLRVVLAFAPAFLFSVAATCFCPMSFTALFVDILLLIGPVSIARRKLLPAYVSYWAAEMFGATGKQEPFYPKKEGPCK